MKDLKTNLQITKCFELIKTILNLPGVLEEFFSSIEGCIEDLLGYLDHLDKIDFEELILDVMVLIIKSVPIMINSYKRLQTFFAPIFQKNNS